MPEESVSWQEGCVRRRSRDELGCKEAACSGHALSRSLVV